MKRLLSILLAILMVSSCCVGAVNALYYETVTETDYVYKETATLDKVFSDRKTDVRTAYENRTYSSISGLEYLSGMDFIDAIIGFNTTTTPNQYIEFPVLDAYGNETSQKYNEIADITVTKQMELFGVPVYDLYYGKESLFFWKNLTSYVNMVDSEGNPIDITKADISLAQGNINLYLLRALKSMYSDFRLYSDANAVSIINYIGNLFFTNFRELPKGTLVFKTEDYLYKKGGVNYADESVFFKTVADKSGLSQLIQINWCDRGSAVDFKPLLSLLGVVVDDLLERDFTNGSTLATELVRAFFLKVLSEGPVNYAVNILTGLSNAYQLYYFTPIAALFAQKINTGYISEAELKTISGLLNLIFNDNNYVKEYDSYGNVISERRAKAGEYDRNKFQFAPLPEWKLTNAGDATEYTLYLLMYCNINAHYRNNASLISNFKVKIANDSRLDAYEDKINNVIIDMIAGDDIERKLLEFSLSDILTENLEEKPSEIILNLKEAFARFLKRIADWWEMWMKIFSGELEFGAGAFN